MSKQLEQYLDNPNVQAFLAMIRDAEGTNQTGNPYQTRFGGKVDENLDLSKYPTFEYKKFKQTDGKTNVSGAVGAYQFITKTWANLAKQYGFKDFSPKTQDLAAIALLQQNGALPLILKGDFQGATKKSNRTWASLPGSPYAQHTRSSEYVAKSLSKHLGQPVDMGKYDVNTAQTQQPEQNTPEPPKMSATVNSTSQTPVATQVASKPTLWAKIKSIFSRKA